MSDKYRIRRATATHGHVADARPGRLTLFDQASMPPCGLNFERGTMLAMTQGKRISADIGGDALKAILELGAAAKLARLGAGEGQAAAAARLGVHVQTIGRIEAGAPGVSIGHVLGLLAHYGISVSLQLPDAH